MDQPTQPPWFQRLDFEQELERQLTRALPGDQISLILLRRTASRHAARSLYRLATAALQETGGFSGLLGDGDCVLCVPGVGKEDAEDLGQVLRDAMGEANLNFAVAVFPADGRLLTELLSVARTAL